VPALHEVLHAILACEVTAISRARCRAICNLCLHLFRVASLGPVAAAIALFGTVRSALARSPVLVPSKAAVVLADRQFRALVGEVGAAGIRPPAVRITGARLPFLPSSALVVRAGRGALLCVVLTASATLCAVPGALAGLVAIEAGVAAKDLTASHVWARLREVLAAVSSLDALCIALTSFPVLPLAAASVVFAGRVAFLLVIFAAVTLLVTIPGALARLAAVVARVTAPHLTASELRARRGEVVAAVTAPPAVGIAAAALPVLVGTTAVVLARKLTLPRPRCNSSRTDDMTLKVDGGNVHVGLVDLDIHKAVLLLTSIATVWIPFGGDATTSSAHDIAHTTESAIVEVQLLGVAVRSHEEIDAVPHVHVRPVAAHELIWRKVGNNDLPVRIGLFQLLVEPFVLLVPKLGEPIQAAVPVWHAATACAARTSSIHRTTNIMARIGGPGLRISLVGINHVDVNREIGGGVVDPSSVVEAGHNPSLGHLLMFGPRVSNLLIPRRCEQSATKVMVAKAGVEWNVHTLALVHVLEDVVELSVSSIMDLIHRVATVQAPAIKTSKIEVVATTQHVVRSEFLSVLLHILGYEWLGQIVNAPVLETTTIGVILRVVCRLRKRLVTARTTARPCVGIARVVSFTTRDSAIVTEQEEVILLLLLYALRRPLNAIVLQWLRRALRPCLGLWAEGFATDHDVLAKRLALVVSLYLRLQQRDALRANFFVLREFGLALCSAAATFECSRSRGQKSTERSKGRFLHGRYQLEL